MGGKNQRNLRRIFHPPFGVSGCLVETRDFFRWLQFADDTAFPQQEFAWSETAVALLRGDLQPGQLGLGRHREADGRYQGRGRQDCESQTERCHMEKLRIWDTRHRPYTDGALVIDCLQR